MNVLLGVLLSAVILVAVNSALTFVFGVIRRPLVVRWLIQQRLEPLDLRITYWVWSGPRWTATYRVRVRDVSGHESTGTAFAMGRLRRNTWVEWD